MIVLYLFMLTYLKFQYKLDSVTHSKINLINAVTDDGMGYSRVFVPDCFH